MRLIGRRLETLRLSMNSEKQKSTEVEKTDNPQLARLELAGQIDYFADYDYKASRRGRDEKLKRLLEERHD